MFGAVFIGTVHNASTAVEGRFRAVAASFTPPDPAPQSRAIWVLVTIVGYNLLSRRFAVVNEVQPLFMSITVIVYVPGVKPRYVDEFSSFFCGEGPSHKIAFRLPVPKNVPGKMPVVLLLVAFTLYIAQVKAEYEKAIPGFGGLTFWYIVTTVLLGHQFPNGLSSMIVNV